MNSIYTNRLGANIDVSRIHRRRKTKQKTSILKKKRRRSKKKKQAGQTVNRNKTFNGKGVNASAANVSSGASLNT